MDIDADFGLPLDSMSSDTEREILTVAGREVAISNPRKVLFPQAGYTKLDLARYYLAVADGALRGAGGRPNVLVRYPNGIDGEFFYQKRAPRVAARLDRGRRAAVSVRPHARKKSCRATRRRSRGWPTSPASSCTRIRCAPTISIIPTSCASISIRCRASSGRRSARSRASSARRSTTSASSAGRRPRARAACTSTCASSGAGRSTRCAAPRWRSRARSSGARPALATSKWWKEERHGVFLDYNQNAKDRTIAERLLGAADARRARVGAADVGRDRRLRSGRLHAGDDAGALRGDRRSARGDRRARRARSSALLELSARQRARGPGRRAVAAALPASSRASRRACSRRAGATPKHPLDRDRPRAEEGRRARRPRALEGAPSRGGAHLEPADVLVDAMRGRFHTWTRIRVNLQHVPAELRPAQEALDPDDDAGRLERRQRPAAAAPKTFSSS